MSFSPSEAAFEGFRIVRRDPMTLVFWSLLYLLAGVAQLLSLQGSGPLLVAVQDASEDFIEGVGAGQADPQPLADAVNALNASQWEAFPVGVLVSILLSAAICRAVLDPKAKAFGFVRLGMTELRLFAVLVGLGILLGLCLFILSTVGAIAIATAVVALGAWGGLVALTVILGTLGLSLWFLVRFSLTAPAVIATDRYAFFASFTATRGRFWSLLGMALLALIMWVVVSLLGAVIMHPIALAGGFSEPDQVVETINLSNPWVIGATVIESILRALSVAVFAAPFAAAYRDIKGVPAAG